MTEPQIEELVNFQYADDEQALKELMEEEEFKFDESLLTPTSTTDQQGEDAHCGAWICHLTDQRF